MITLWICLGAVAGASPFWLFVLLRRRVTPVLASSRPAGLSMAALNNCVPRLDRQDCTHDDQVEITTLPDICVMTMCQRCGVIITGPPRTH